MMLGAAAASMRATLLLALSLTQLVVALVWVLWLAIKVVGLITIVRLVSQPTWPWPWPS